ncbi:Calmodulin-like protein 1 (OsCaM61) [Durusdinium trenchii]|uniref:Calmodulin-like protein 1 (OsCaM61) n=1 Tax=Durusdinium trenchii TaxID=1381693 RepID=A0ABP0QJ85_9DINO
MKWTQELYGGKRRQSSMGSRPNSPVTGVTGVKGEGDPLARLFASRPLPSLVASDSTEQHGAVARRPPMLLLATAAAAFRKPPVKAYTSRLDQLDLIGAVQPSGNHAGSASAPKKRTGERLSLTSWAVNGFTGLLHQPEPRREGLASKVQHFRKRNALDLGSARRSVDFSNEEPEMEHALSSFVPLSLFERKPPETWTNQGRRSRKSSAKPRPSAALGGANRGRWLASFNRYLYDGEIHSDDIPRALLHCGFEDTRPRLVASALQKVAEYNTLDEDEFLHFMCEYEEELKEDAFQHFQKYMADGRLPFSSLPSILKEMELQPCRRVLTQLTEEVMGEPRGLTLPEFERTLELLRARYCFLLEELEHFKNVFQVFDRDCSGGMSLAELSSAFAWLGFPITGSVCRLHQQHDLDDKGALTQTEFLRCLRSLYEEEAQEISRRLARKGGRCRNGLQLEELLRALGYTATVDILVDALQAQHLCKGYVRNSQLLGMPFAQVEFNLGLDELRELTCSIRERDSFTDEEMEEMKVAFALQSKSQAEIATPALQKALRWLGHLYHFDRVQHLVQELDLDGDGLLDFTLFVKLLRKCRDQDRQKATEAFFEFDSLDLGFLDEDHQFDAFQRLGFDEDVFRPELRPEGLRLQQFLKIVQRFKSDPTRLRALRDQDFFEAHELAELRRHFQRFDKDASGELKEHELVDLLEALFPRHAHLREFRPFFRELLHFADVNQNERLDFREFVRLLALRDDSEAGRK